MPCSSQLNLCCLTWVAINIFKSIQINIYCSQFCLHAWRFSSTDTHGRHAGTHTHTRTHARTHARTHHARTHARTSHHIVECCQCSFRSAVRIKKHQRSRTSEDNTDTMVVLACQYQTLITKPLRHIGPWWWAKRLTHLKVHGFPDLIVKAGRVLHLDDDSSLRSSDLGNNPQTARVSRQRQAEHTVGTLGNEKKKNSIENWTERCYKQSILRPEMTC